MNRSCREEGIVDSGGPARDVLFARPDCAGSRWLENTWPESRATGTLQSRWPTWAVAVPVSNGVVREDTAACILLASTRDSRRNGRSALFRVAPSHRRSRTFGQDRGNSGGMELELRARPPRGALLQEWQRILVWRSAPGLARVAHGTPCAAAVMARVGTRWGPPHTQRTMSGSWRGPAAPGECELLPRPPPVLMFMMVKFGVRVRGVRRRRS